MPSEGHPTILYNLWKCKRTLFITKEGCPLSRQYFGSELSRVLKAAGLNEHQYNACS